MGYIPGGKEVEHSLKQALKDIKASIKQTNVYAGKLVSRGDYTEAEELISVAQKISDFALKVEALTDQWQEIVGKQNLKGKGKENHMPLWQYYTPTLQSIINLGGSAKTEEIRHDIESKAGSLFPMTETILKGDQPRWFSMVRRALGAMEKEGFVQRIKKEWQITPTGRKASESELVR
jgi:hypothetical protein